MAKRSSLVAVWLLIILAVPLHAQVNRYIVVFKNKQGSPYSVSTPQQFLSQKSIDRRVRQGIAVDERDLPVVEANVAALRGTGAEVFFRSRWMNAVLVQCDASLLPAVQALAAVDRVELVAPEARLARGGRKRGEARIKATGAEVTDTQLSMVGIDAMHADGFLGQGLTIAVLDAGFPGVDTAPAFSALFAEGRIDLAASHDFVYNTSHVFQYDAHGTEVFSVIAAHQEGVFTGGAYGARYQLYVTEDAAEEYRIEEYNWLFAAERADSAGADIIQSSLGYYDFDDASMNYSKAALDGKTTVITRAAQWAADRGIAVVCSAGNEGAVSWQLITAPADARGVLAVASVNSDKIRSNSSSKGPSADGRLKPDVAAQGVSTNVIKANGGLGTVSGTSLAAPIITSLVAGVWQRYPDLTAAELLEVIRLSGSQVGKPDTLLGYGIPHYKNIERYFEQRREHPFRLYPNPIEEDSLRVRSFLPEEFNTCQVELISSDGKRVIQKSLHFSAQTPEHVVDLSLLGTGLYICRISWAGGSLTQKLVRR
jgi:serine protease AprX